MTEKIVSVKKDEVKIWLGFASQVWSSDMDYLQEAFLNDQFPYEFLYWRAGKTLAWLSLSIRKEYVEGSSHLPLAYLEGIAVTQEARQQGIAQELLAFAKLWAKAHGCVQLASDCSLENIASQAFHHKMGFREVSRSVHYILNVD